MRNKPVAEHFTVLATIMFHVVIVSTVHNHRACLAGTGETAGIIALPRLQQEAAPVILRYSDRISTHGLSFVADHTVTTMPCKG